MNCITAEKDELAAILADLGAEDMLYRGLSEKSEEEYRETGILLPHDGNMSVGCGVFFTDSLGYALGFAKKTLLITSRRRLDPEQKAIDTRIEGYAGKARASLDVRSGRGNYTCWDLWAEIQRDDTITDEGGSGYVYTRRTAVSKDELIAEINIMESHALAR